MGARSDSNGDGRDRLLLGTRVLAFVVIPVLVAAFIILFGFPSRTKQLWAWTLKPELTASIMGAAYLSGAWFFVRSVYDGRWHRVAIGWLAVIPFTGFLGVATLIHWDKFNHDHVSFWAWLLLYSVTPTALPGLWIMNQRAAGAPSASTEVELPHTVRWLVAGSGAALLVVAAIIFVKPESAISRAPWVVTPLTARSLASFSTFLAFVWLAFAFTGRWSRLAISFEATTLGLLMVAVSAVRSYGDFESGARATTFVVLLAVSVAGTLALLVWATRRGRRPDGRPGRRGAPQPR